MSPSLKDAAGSLDSWLAHARIDLRITDSPTPAAIRIGLTVPPSVSPFLLAIDLQDGWPRSKHGQKGR